jgi:AhpD family alkylhydroperoxidase
VTHVPFRKRIYTWSAVREAVGDVFSHMEDLRRAGRAGRVSRQFAEKIMLAVTRVNGCRYCAYGHTRAALALGVPEAEVQEIMAGELGGFPEQEAVALAFAQHSAESACHPDADARRRLVDTYGDETALDMLAYMRMITFGNLYGNTFDALLSRLAGNPAAGSSLWSELGVLLGVLVLVPIEMLKRLLKSPSPGLRHPEETSPSIRREGT